MRRLYILLFCILFGVNCEALLGSEMVEVPVVDGYLWEKSTKNCNLAWATGFQCGIFQAGKEGSIFPFTVPELMERKVAGTYEEAEEVTDELFNEFLDRIYWGGINYGQLVAGLDEFYKDYRNKKIVAREAVYIIKLEFTGASQEFIDRVTRILRMPLEDRAEEQESLLVGNQEYRTAWEKWGKYLPLSVIPTPQ